MNIREAKLLNAEYGVSREASYLVIGLSLPLRPYVVFARSEGSDETAHMRRLV